MFKKTLAFCQILLMQFSAFSQASYLKEYIKADSLFRESAYKESLPIFDEILSVNISDSFKAEIFNRKGFIFSTMQGDDSALYFYFKALEIFKTQNNRSRSSLVCRNIGNVHFYKRNYNKALDYFNLSLAAAATSKDSLNRYFDICNLYQTRMQYSNVYEVITHHILKFRQNLVPQQAYLVSMNLGLYFNGINNHDSALFHYKKALTLVYSDENLFVVYADISNEYRLQKMYDQAIVYLDSANLVIKNFGGPRDSLILYDSFREIYEEMGEDLKALKYSQLARVLSDTIYNAQQVSALQEAEVKYQTAKKEAANQILLKDNTIKQRNLFFSFIALGLVALLGFISFNSYRQKQKANTILIQQRNQVQQLATELDVANQTKARLFSTIGHDLRGPVSSLYAMLKMQEIKGGGNTAYAATMSSHTITLLDTLEDLLVWSKTQMDRFVPMPVTVYVDELYKEMSVFFTAGAMAKNVTIVTEAIPGLVLHCDENILRTILRNIISNALNNAPVGTTIQLTAILKAENIVCTVKNHGTKEGFEKFKQAFDNAGVQSSSHGLGLVMVKEFAPKINASISLGYSEGLVAVSLLLPVKV